MEILISADMEGATGVTWSLDVEPRGDEWHRFRKLFTEDVNAVARGLFDGGAEAVLINEAHASMRNLLLEDLDERVRLLTGRHKPLGMMQGILGTTQGILGPTQGSQDGAGQAAVDGVAFVGYHAGAGERGVLAHTYLANSITGVWLDGTAASEGYLNAALATELGVPVILITGDDYACADAQGYAPNAPTAVLKTYVSRYAAVCLPPSVTSTLQREAAASGMALAGRTAAEVRPRRMEVEFDATHLAEAAATVPTVELIGDRRIGFDSHSMLRAITTFRVVASVAAGAREGAYG